jgi:hypothetical protein
MVLVSSIGPEDGSGAALSGGSSYVYMCSSLFCEQQYQHHGKKGRVIDKHPLWDVGRGFVCFALHSKRNSVVTLLGYVYFPIDQVYISSGYSLAFSQKQIRVSINYLRVI